METVYLNGTACHTYGALPRIGDKAPAFKLTTADLGEIDLNDLRGNRVVLNIFPSIDTGVCATSVRRFNAEAAKHPDTKVVCVSMDLPFAAKRFCAAEGIDNLVVASAFRSPMFAQKYGVEIVDGPLAGLLARAVIVIDEKGNVAYTQLVNEIATEPDYDSALKALKEK
ncbi:MAG: thiol peroxidase [Pseudoflavonifractor sp.]|nr:thiol peroxidase [Pseudoflavonifractor sp.]